MSPITSTGLAQPPKFSSKEAILDVVTDGILAFDDQGVVLYVNATAHVLLDRDDLIGKNCGLPATDSFDSTDVQLVRRKDILWAQLR